MSDESASRSLRTGLHTIKVNLSAVIVYDLASLLHAGFENSKRAGIRDLLGTCISTRLTFCQVFKKEPTMKAARVSLYFSAFSLRSARSRLPSERVLTGMTFMPAMIAL